jgi:hypothetical protein
MASYGRLKQLGLDIQQVLHDRDNLQNEAERNQRFIDHACSILRDVYTEYRVINNRDEMVERIGIFLNRHDKTGWLP